MSRAFTLQSRVSSLLLQFRSVCASNPSNSLCALVRSSTSLREVGVAKDEARSRIATEAQHGALEQLELLSKQVESPLQRLEHALHPWVAFVIVPVFALANAHVHLPSGFDVILGSTGRMGRSPGSRCRKAPGHSPVRVVSNKDRDRHHAERGRLDSDCWSCDAGWCRLYNGNLRDRVGI